MNYGIHKYKGEDYPQNVGEEIEVIDDNSKPKNPSYLIRFLDESVWVDGMDDDDIDWQN